MQNAGSHCCQICKNSQSNIENACMTLNCRTCSFTLATKNFINWQWSGTCQQSLSSSRASNQAWGRNASLTWAIISMCKTLWLNVPIESTSVYNKPELVWVLYGKCKIVWQRPWSVFIFFLDPGPKAPEASFQFPVHSWSCLRISVRRCGNPQSEKPLFTIWLLNRRSLFLHCFHLKKVD